MAKYNHDREVEDFQEDLEVIREEGFNPIAVTQMYFEETFVFETPEEANRAFQKLEANGNSRVIGWWYGKEDFLHEVDIYEKENEGYSKVRIHWLNKK